MSSTYGIAGTSPLALPAVTTNKAVCDAIKAKWDSDYATPLGLTYPLATNITWLQTWYVGVRDLEFTFLQGFVDPVVASTDGRYEDVTETVDVHIWVKGAGGDVEPTALPKVLNGLKTVIGKNKSTLLTWANSVTMDSIQRAGTDEDSSFKVLWHYLAKIRVKYYQVSTV